MIPELELLNLELLALLSFSLVAGAFGAAIGAGGGFLIVPVLAVVFRMPPQEAVGTTALAVLLISVMATASYLPRRRVATRVALATAATGIPGAAVGSWLLTELASGRGFIVTLGMCYLMLAGFIVLQFRAASPSVASPAMVSWRALTAGGGVVGMLTGAFAAGGGLLTLPLLMRWGGLTIERATATTALAILPSAAAVAMIQIAQGHVPWSGLVVAVVAVVGARIGAVWSTRWAPTNLVWLTSVAVAVMGVLTLGRGLNE